jgi:hypothetical protein
MRRTDLEIKDPGINTRRQAGQRVTDVDQTGGKHSNQNELCRSGRATPVHSN